MLHICGVLFTCDASRCARFLAERSWWPGRSAISDNMRREGTKPRHRPRDTFPCRRLNKRTGGIPAFHGRCILDVNRVDESIRFPLQPENLNPSWYSFHGRFPNPTSLPTSLHMFLLTLCARLHPRSHAPLGLGNRHDMAGSTMCTGRALVPRQQHPSGTPAH